MKAEQKKSVRLFITIKTIPYFAHTEKFMQYQCSDNMTIQVNKWCKKRPTKAGYYWVKVRGELSGEVYTHIVKVCVTKTHAWVFYDGENYDISEDRFVKWSTQPIEPPVE
jgi:hypothetical protein